MPATVQLIITGVDGEDHALHQQEFQRLTFRSDTQLSDSAGNSQENTNAKLAESSKLPFVKKQSCRQSQQDNAQPWKSSRKGKDLPPNQKIIKPTDIGGVGWVDQSGPALSSSDGRLKTLTKVASHNRKVVSMLNDQMKERCILSNQAMDRVQKQERRKLSKAQKPVLQSLEDLRDIKRSLAAVAADDTLDDVYGYYGGKTAREAQVIMQVKTAHMTAQELREKRYRQVHDILERGLSSGRLTDGHELVKQLGDLTEQPFPEFKLRPKTVKKGKGDFLLPALKMGLQTVQMSGKGYSNFHIASSSTFVGMQPIVPQKK